MAFDIKSIFSGRAAGAGDGASASAGATGSAATGGQEGAKGAEGQGQAKGAAEAGPLDAFKFLVDNKGAADGEGDAGKQITFNKSSEVLTPEALSALSQKLDFSSAISDASLEALKAGKPEALINVMNDIARASYTAALQHSGALSDSILDARFTGLSKKLPSSIGEVLTEHGLKENIAGFDNPIVKEGMKGIADRVRLAHPDATPKEVAKMTQDYFTALASVINPQSSNTDIKNAAVDINWIEYALSGESGKG